MKVSIPLSALLDKFSEDCGKIYLCITLSEIVHAGPAKHLNFTNIHDYTIALHSALAEAYPMVFYTLEQTDRQILDLWLRAEYFKSIPANTFTDGIYGYHNYAHNGVMLESIRINRDHRFKCQLLRHLIETFGDCQIGMEIPVEE